MDKINFKAVLKPNLGSLCSLNLLCFILVFSLLSYSQIGINTSNPKGTLDVTSINNTGLVIPRVTAVEDVTDGTGNPPENGTQVYDTSRNAMCFYQDNNWICMGSDSSGNPVLINVTQPGVTNFTNSAVYIKSSNNDLFDHFGYRTALSSDGNTLAVSARFEGSNATGINGDQTNNATSGSGAVYVFVKTANLWSQQAYIKASNTGSSDYFGSDLAFSSDGNTLAVGASSESSSATGVNGNQNDNAAGLSGVIYVFVRSGLTWSQQAYIKASNTGDNDAFGESLTISNDGNTLAVGAPYEDSNAQGMNGLQTNNSSVNSGAVYVFTRTGTTWSQEAYIKASNAGISDRFGSDLAISGNGNTLAVGALHESSNTTGANGNELDNSMTNSGAVYIFTRVTATWSQHTYIKASNTNANDYFGQAVALSADGSTLAVGAYGEDSNAIGVNGTQTDNTASNSGAVYIFDLVGSIWTQQAYIKSSNSESSDYVGRSIALSGDGNTLVTGAVGILNQGFDGGEDSNATGIDGNQTDNSEGGSGAVYAFSRSGGMWTQKAYIKSIDSDSEDYFGFSISLSHDGNILAATAVLELSEAIGIGGDATNDAGFYNGAAYVYTAN